MSNLVKPLRVLSVGTTSALPAPWQPRPVMRYALTPLEKTAVRASVDLILGAARNPAEGSAAPTVLRVLRNAVQGS